MHRELSRRAATVGRGRVPGQLLDLGAFPGRVRDPAGGGPVVGEVYRLRDPDRALHVFDAYEGCGPDDPEPHLFRRDLEVVRLEDGGIVRAWVYSYQGERTGARVISSGDYAEAP